MRTICLSMLLALSALPVLAQNDSLTLDEDLLRSAEKWAQENLDEDALRVLQTVDRDKVSQFFARIQKEFHGQYVVDLAPLKNTARTMLPLLEKYEETFPYAVWLKTRIDYLDAADEFSLLIPRPKPEPGRPPPPPANPPPQKERELWTRKLSERPWPAGARTYASRIKPIFASERVPPELVWLAEVESSFDPRARSPVGAAGLFQLMPATAERFGLKTARPDERLDPEPSARAAAKYLRFLHGRFNDWRLALAAYNAGEGTVGKALARRKARTFDAVATQLPAETQFYVPKIEATLLRREGLKLEDLQVPSSAATR